jgi:hypothetical protein
MTTATRTAKQKAMSIAKCDFHLGEPGVTELAFAFGEHAACTRNFGVSYVCIYTTPMPGSISHLGFVAWVAA